MPAKAAERRAAIIHRFHQFIERYVDETIYLAELCKEVGASERTLRACCHKHLGMGPKRYLRVLRMNMFRKALQESTTATATVTEIATSYGFWQFGRLALEYKVLFGEPPSATLQRYRRSTGNRRLYKPRRASTGHAHRGMNVAAPGG
jgi:AraC family ethanolamine operon transcriptional activator